MRKFLQLFFAVLICSSCNQSSINKSQIKKPTAPEDNSVSVASDEQIALSHMPFELLPGQIASQYAYPAGAEIWSAENLPDWLVLDSTTGALNGLSPASGFFENIRLFRIFEGQRSILGPFSIRIKTDPLFSQQWHLSNNGQNSFSEAAGIAGEDINVIPVYNQGLTGKDILIGISDVAVQSLHEDLIGNIKNSESRDYVNSSASSNYAGTPEPDPTSAFASHGTGVAGVIAAMGWNGLGIMGTAPKSKIASLNFIESDQSLFKILNQITGPFDIINQSWGVSPDFPLLMETEYRQALLNATKNQRNGLGSLIVKAAGNGYYSCGSQSFCSENANQDPYNNSPYVIVVGALNAMGFKSSYSAVGSNLWISAPGGEFGTDEPAILSTDLMGCSEGSSKTDTNNLIKNNFDKGLELQNTFCNYMSSFNGTSAATPVVSGAIALILEANPQLSWRDVKYILAKSARKVDPSSAGKRVTASSGPVDFSLGWVENAAGFFYNNDFGFGALDVAAAVQLAKNFNSLPPMAEVVLGSSENINKTIGSGNNTEINLQQNSAYNLTTESLELELELAHEYFGDLAVEVTSPSGTRSILLTPLNTYIGQTDSNNQPVMSTYTLQLLSHAFYGETSQGTWSIKIKDQITGDSGTIKNLKLKIYGY